MAKAIERRRASTNVLIGRKPDMCFTNELFQRRRRMRVLIKILRRMIRISVNASEALVVFTTSLIIFNIVKYIFFWVKYKDDQGQSQGLAIKWF